MRVLAPLVLLSLALVAAGCGGGTSPSVASLGAAGTTTDSSGGPAAGGAGAGGTASAGGPGVHLEMKLQNGEKFSQCMRKNGVPSFPDPSANGSLSIDSSSGIDPRSPRFQHAQQICRKVLPNGGRPTPQQIQQAQQNALEFSRCMRSHGVKDFPDPNFTANGGGFKLKVGSAGSDLNPSSAVFQKAMQTCQAKFGFAK